MKSKKNKFPLFLVFSFVSAFVFEEIPRIVLDLLGAEVIHVWSFGKESFFVFFIVWYGIVFSISYYLFNNRKIRYAVLFGVIFGMIAETFVFKEMNAVSFFIFPILYGLMFYFPFRIISRLGSKKYE